MKKNLWMLGMAVALTSCTQNEVLDIPESRTIGFDSFVGKESRADLENNNFTKFIVYCAKGDKQNDRFVADNGTGNYYMHNIQVSRSSSDDAWGYTGGAKEWLPGKYYRFAAYADGEGVSPQIVAEEGGTSPSVTFSPSTDYTIRTSATNDSQTATVTDRWGLNISNYTASTKDLVAAVSLERNTVDPSSGQSTVNLTFAHLLAKVQFRFSYVVTDTDEYDTEVRLYPFYMKAIKTASCDAFYDDEFESEYSDANKTYTYVNWDSQFNTINDYLTTNPNKLDNYIYFPTPAGKEYTATELNAEKNQAAIIYTNYVIPQSNNFSICTEDDNAIVAEIWKKQAGSSNEYTLSSKLTYKDISLKIANNPVWKPGHLYRYEAKLNTDKKYIEFTASTKAWIDTKNDDTVIGGGTESKQNDDDQQ